MTYNVFGGTLNLYLSIYFEGGSNSRPELGLQWSVIPKLYKPC